MFLFLIQMPIISDDTLYLNMNQPVCYMTVCLGGIRIKKNYIFRYLYHVKSVRGGYTSPPSARVAVMRFMQQTN